MENNTIFFDGFQSPLGNGYEIWFKDHSDQEYSSSEQYMMAKKAELFKDFEIKKQILKSTDPNEQKLLGREIKNFDQNIWSAVSEIIVEQGLQYKFSQNYHILKYLKDTTPLHLAYLGLDKIWGIGLTIDEINENPEIEWPGKNLLGNILMKYRSSLKF